MGKNFFQMNELVLPIFIFLISVFVALILEFVVIARIRNKILSRNVKGNEYIVKSIKGLSFFLFLIIGLYVSTHLLPIDKNAMKWVDRIGNIIIAFFLTIALTRLFTGIIKFYLSKGDESKKLNSVLVNSFSVVLYSIGILIILETNGINVTPILTALGVGGLAVALALQDTLANLFAGFFIAVNNKLKPGDYIRLESGEEGIIEDIGWRTTLLKEIGNTRIVVPNTKLSSLKVKNFTVEENEITASIQIGVAYDSDLEFVEKITMQVVTQAMYELQGCSTKTPPVMRLHTFGDFSIIFTVFFRIKSYEYQFPVKHELIKRIHKKYKEVGIVIPFPIRTIITKD